MLKLRILLLRNILYYIILFIAILYFVIVNFFVNKESVYNDEMVIEAKIVDIKIKDYGINLTLKGKEKFLGYYYINQTEINEFKNNYILGDKVKIEVEGIDIPNNTVPNTFNYKKYLYNNKIYKVFEIKSIEKIGSNNNIFYGIKNMLLKRSYKLENSYNYINTLLFGNTNDIDNDVMLSYRENGISHLFAISGLHISIFISVIEKLLKKLKIKENKRYVIMILFLLLFMFLTNFSISVMRSGIFTILLIINKIFYFYIKPQNLLLLTLSIIIFINPLNIYNIGLQYSFLISLALILMSKYIENKKGYLNKLFITSLISFIVSLPITIYNFYQVNLLSIFYNLFFVPYVSYIILPLTIVSYIFPFLDKILHFLIMIMENISLFLCKIDILKIIICKPSVSIFFLYFGFIILFLKGLVINKKRLLVPLISLLFLNIIWPFYKTDGITFLDVGQGDSILLNVNFTYTLIDTGGLTNVNDSKYTYTLVKNKIIPYLKSMGIRNLDNLILTHGDYDHMGEAINLVENFKVEKVIFNCGEFNDLEQELIRVLDKKKIPYYSCIKELNIDDNKLYFLNNQDYCNENDNSSVIYTEFNNHKFLFMGDAGVEVEEDLIKKYNLKDIDVLKVGHHGSKTSSGEKFITEINPKYSIISVGKNNRYGHPNKEVLDNLENSIIYRTDQDGSVMFKMKNNKLQVETCAP